MVSKITVVIACFILSSGPSIHPWLVALAIWLILNATFYAEIGEISKDVATFFISSYKFLLSPLTKDYKAKEANYKEIIKSLQKQISKD